ncbi:MAG: primosomal protein N' [Geobacter sp.]|nr:primosomal protein N' [Geobacter sp.]
MLKDTDATVTTTEQRHTQIIPSPPLPIRAFVEVAVPLPLDRTFHYRVPFRLQDRIIPGIRVLVPFGRRRISAYVLGFGEPPPEQQLKEVLDLLDESPLWTEAELTFFRWVAAYYLHPLGEVLKTALPSGINLQSKGQADQQPLTGGRKVKKERWYLRTEVQTHEPKGKVFTILTYLQETGAAPSSELRLRFGDCSLQLKKLREQGLISMEEREVYRDPFSGLQVGQDRPKPLTHDQQQAVTAIVQALDTGHFAPFLLQGVTGSGKTEVYLQAIAHTLQAGNNALVLVPEISLTPQLVQRFRARFSLGIAVLHSGLSDGERYDEWRRIRRGEVRMVIGARSAIFAPLERISVIVVDEEHESSFKQGDGLRYNARDLALVRGQQEQAVVLLGSATPLVTTRYAAQQGRLGYLSLPERVGARPMPEVSLATSRLTAEVPIPAALAETLAENLHRGEQSLVFLNRRGFASWLACPSCGADLQCPNCSVSLTYHRQRRISLCHYCDYHVPFPCICPACDEPELKEMGVGTERIEHALLELFPAARIARMDSDTVSGKGGHARILDKVRLREVDILVGTQMITKGHDFPGVTLVVVLQAEGSLYQPDFRAAERTFQVLSQVIGRAGRGELPGRVLLQAAQPDHYAVACAAQHDYQQFYRQELQYREELGYPPYGHLAAIRLSAITESALTDSSEQAAVLIRAIKQEMGTRTEVLGPAPAPLYRLRGRFRSQILLKDGSRIPLRQLLAEFRNRLELPQNVRLAIDIDPVEMQ